MQWDKYCSHGGNAIGRQIKWINQPVLAITLVFPNPSRMDGDRFTEELPGMVTRSANVVEISAKFS
jgi:hypothetical protein